MISFNNRTSLEAHSMEVLVTATDRPEDSTAAFQQPKTLSHRSLQFPYP